VYLHKKVLNVFSLLSKPPVDTSTVRKAALKHRLTAQARNQRNCQPLMHDKKCELLEKAGINVV